MIPTKGYQSLTAAVAALMEQGKSDESVAAELGISKNRVAVAKHSIRKHSKRQPAGTHSGINIEVPRTLMADLAPHAARRGMTPSKLAREILIAVIMDRMVDAVMDDEEDRVPASHMQGAVS
jgi:hypothetical protein